MSRMVFAALGAALAASCGGPQLGLNYGTNYCTPTRIEAGKVVHATSGKPFEWRPRRRRGDDVSIELGWGEHRRFKGKYCKGQHQYTLTFRSEVCFVADGVVTSAKVTRHSDSRDLDRDFEEAALEMRYCPFPEGTPPRAPICVTTNHTLNVPCD